MRATKANITEREGIALNVSFDRITYFFNSLVLSFSDKHKTIWNVLKKSEGEAYERLHYNKRKGKSVFFFSEGFM